MQARCRDQQTRLDIDLQQGLNITVFEECLREAFGIPRGWLLRVWYFDANDNAVSLRSLLLHSLTVLVALDMHFGPLQLLRSINNGAPALWSPLGSAHRSLRCPVPALVRC